VLGNHDASPELTDYDHLITDSVVGQDNNRCGALNNLTRYEFGHSAFEQLVPQNELINAEMAAIEVLFFEYFDIGFVHSHRFSEVNQGQLKLIKNFSKFSRVFGQITHEISSFGK
jgi:hypothetical protein